MSPKNLVDRRAVELDTIAAVLPIDRRDQLAELLTDQDVETLRHLVNEGMGDNTLRALASDLAYLQAWSLAATGALLPWPAPEAMLLKFVAHHLWRPEQRDLDPEHGMPSGFEQSLREQGFLRAAGPHAPSTVRRRLAMERRRRRLQLPCPQIRHSAGRPRRHTAATAKERQGDHR